MTTRRYPSIEIAGDSAAFCAMTWSKSTVRAGGGSGSQQPGVSAGTSARELSEDAERELERAGRSIAVICGDQLVAALIAAGVGVVSAAAPLHYVDDQLLDELLAG